MQIEEQDDGRFIFAGENPVVAYRFEASPTGELLDHRVEVKVPLAQRQPAAKAPTPAQAELALARAAACQSCSANQGVSLYVKSWPVFTVKCGDCNCGGLSLIRGQCPQHKWPPPPPEAAGSRRKSAVAGMDLALLRRRQRDQRRRTNPPAPTITVAQLNAQLNGERAYDLRDDHQAHEVQRLIVSPPKTAERLILRNRQCPGDVLMLTAAVRDLHRAHPGRYVTDVQTSCPALWEHNPHVQALHGQGRVIDCEYPAIHQANNRPYHFLHGFHLFLEEKLGVRIPVTEFRGDVHLTERERSWTNQVAEHHGHDGPFWIVMAGGKYDFTAKWWPHEHYQAVVDHFRERVRFVQCGEADHWHEPLAGAINLVGRTDLRQFVRLMHHAAGVLCPVTFAMHLAAAVPTPDGRLRPCVVVAGGREPAHWEAYPGHAFLDRVGRLDCCRQGGCWKSRCQTVGDASDKDDPAARCPRPVRINAEVTIQGKRHTSYVVPECMAAITPDDVIREIERFL